jgi:regulatory protein
MSNGADRAYAAGLALLARRELAEAQVRQRLARRRFEPEDIDAAVQRLRSERALDDRRTALACARTEVRLKRRGRARVVRQIEALGIGREIAREAAAEVFAELDEDELLRDAVDRRLSRGADVGDPAVLRRLHRYLIGQGFDAARAASYLRERAKKKKSL